jgi:hypothetical protein
MLYENFQHKQRLEDVQVSDTKIPIARDDSSSERWLNKHSTFIKNYLY